MTEPGTRGPAEEPVDATPAPAAEAEAPSEPAAETDVGSGATGAEFEEPRGRVCAGASRFRFHVPRTRRGIFALLLVVGAFAFAGIWTSVTLVHWTETADFSGRCPPDRPGARGLRVGSASRRHLRRVPRRAGRDRLGQGQAERHPTADPGAHWPLPAADPAPDHDALPSTTDTCQKCHSLDRLASSSLVTRTSFSEDETNTRAFVGLMIRPGSGDAFDANRGVHWHVLRAWDPSRGGRPAARADPWIGVGERCEDLRPRMVDGDERHGLVALAQSVGPGTASVMGMKRRAGRPGRREGLAPGAGGRSPPPGTAGSTAGPAHSPSESAARGSARRSSATPRRAPRRG